MGNTANRYPRTARRNRGTATGQVPFSPLWQPRRIIAGRSKHPDAVTLLKERTCPACTTLRIRTIKRVFRTATLFHF